MDAKTVQTTLAMLPIAIDLTNRLIIFARDAKKEGYKIPSIKELKNLNEELKELSDLELEDISDLETP